MASPGGFEPRLVDGLPEEARAELQAVLNSTLGLGLQRRGWDAEMEEALPVSGLDHRFHWASFVAIGL